jgi:hypothetical protein
MTGVLRLEDWVDEVSTEFMATKENPEEWYVVTGSMCGEYSVHDAEQPPEIAEHQDELPPQERPADENVDGFYQIGKQGWSGDVFADDVDFVGTYAGRSNDEMDTRLLNILVVHEDMLSEEAIKVANGEEVEA